MLVNNDDRPRLLRLLLVVLMFHLHNSICTHHYLHRPAIVPPSESPWQKLYDRGGEGGGEGSGGGAGGGGGSVRIT